MKVVADNSIAFLNGVLEPYAEVVYKDSADICREDLLDADCLMVRSHTRCNAELLEGTSVKLIATATVGTDHIDKAWCSEHGIFFQNSPGSNAGSVMNYVCSALYGLAARRGIVLDGCTVGIVGVGSCGSRVERMASNLGFKTLLFDPPRAAKEGPGQFCDLDFLLRNSDVVTLHLPLTDETRGIANASFFSKMKLGAFFINTSRGELVVDDDLKAAKPKLGPVALDAWNNAPDIDRDLLEMVEIATPHIAGYSYQSKLNCTSGAVRAVAHFFGIKDLYEFFPASEMKDQDMVKLELSGKEQGQRASIIQYNYPIFTDDFMFRVNPDDYDRLRAAYRYRREFYIA